MKDCAPQDLSIKSFFLGPQSENADWLRSEFLSILDHWFTWRQDHFPEDGKAISREDQKSPEFQDKRKKMHAAIQSLMSRFENEIPQFSPRYVGHMYSEVSLPALIGHFIALLQNPNIISTEAAKVGSFVEEEAIKALGEMVGFDRKDCTGHFTSGGTVANIEGLWRARYRMDHFLSLGSYLNQHHGYEFTYFSAAHMGWKQYNDLIEKHHIHEPDLRGHSIVALGPWRAQTVYGQTFGHVFQGAVVLVPNSKHYSWLKAVSLLGFGDESFIPIELDSQGVLDTKDLARKIDHFRSQNRPIAMIVSVAGTTELGKCDPVHEVQNILDQQMAQHGYHIWHHVDAAYGGYFCTLKEKLDERTCESLKGIARVNSVTVDPHKLGYIPYACGAFLVPDPINDRVSAFQAEYIQSPHQGIDRWLKTLEGSRAASGATATWMTNENIGLTEDGYGKILEKTIAARAQLEALLSKRTQLKYLSHQNLNLLCLVNCSADGSLAKTNALTERLIERINANGRFMVSKTTLKMEQYAELIKQEAKNMKLNVDTQQMVLLRLTLMNPFLVTKETNISYLQELEKELYENA
ncbi:MAG: hypothetical protein OM95_14090 [Bdellovibrio sp. ArHS]|uniref:pyridoxal phosphate-dependent decarboxylase family protein n=1 Tax=Bdellovibrio sp. ArHS TaxID=1569284 RepID=UPI000583679C|nr:pyridoxal-dependent decarboxylase [Bdellovibrio sp. ArHS]KHD87497.1 MAG: hypothetical protein OM95_14090 [Bdellovibrio sp. ArHS]